MIRKMIALVGLSAFLFVAPRPAVSATGSTDVASPATDGTLKALTAVAGAGIMDTHTYQYLEELSDDIGARVTGSPEAGRAIEWGLEKMKAIGLENVHTESWELSRGWTRISADAEIESPIHRRMTRRLQSSATF
jgi:carboxypeptidase Q